MDTLALLLKLLGHEAVHQGENPSINLQDPVAQLEAASQADPSILDITGGREIPVQRPPSGPPSIVLQEPSIPLGGGTLSTNGRKLQYRRPF